MQRLAAFPVVLLVQDTTEVDFTRPNEVVVDAGPLTYESPIGFPTHAQVAFTPERLCLGTIDADTWGRDPDEFGKRMQQHAQVAIQDKESYRWVLGYQRACAVAAQVPNTQVLSIGDAENDIDECFSAALSTEQARPADGIIRAGQLDRCLAANEEHHQLVQALQGRRALGTFVMAITPKQGRSARTATMEVRSASGTLKRPRRPADQPRLPEVKVNVVGVRETQPPAGEDPVEWMLLTSLPVETFEQACLVADYDACRGPSESYFKILKSGGQVEKLQLETADRIQPCLAMYLIVAWRVLYATMLGRECPELSCEVIFSAAEWKSVWTGQTQEPLPKQAPSLGVFLKVVGELAGHTGQKWDGPLGPKRLWIGLQRTTDFGHAWRLFGPEVRSGPEQKAVAPRSRDVAPKAALV
jgi:Transposase Tn5 dimerisation domain